MDALAAFAAASGFVAMAQRLFVFLVDGVSAKVGRTVARRRWRETVAKVNLALGTSLACGGLSVLMLAVLRAPVLTGLLHLDASVLAAATPYFWLRLGAVPLQLFNMAAAGVLQGFHRTWAAAALSISQAGAELAGCLLLLSLGRGLPGVGLATLASQLLLALASLACLLLLPPLEARGCGFSLWRAWLGGGGGGRGGGDGGVAVEREALLTAAEAEAEDGQLQQQQWQDVWGDVERQSLLRLEAPEDVAAGEAHHVLSPASPRGGRPPQQKAGGRQPAAPAAAAAAAGSAGDSKQEEEEEEEEGEDHTWAFIRDGFDFLARSLILQARPRLAARRRAPAPRPGCQCLPCPALPQPACLPSLLPRRPAGHLLRRPGRGLAPGHRGAGGAQHHQPALGAAQQRGRRPGGRRRRAGLAPGGPGGGGRRRRRGPRPGGGDGGRRQRRAPGAAPGRRRPGRRPGCRSGVLAGGGARDCAVHGGTGRGGPAGRGGLGCARRQPAAQCCRLRVRRWVTGARRLAC